MRSLIFRPARVTPFRNSRISATASARRLLALHRCRRLFGQLFERAFDDLFRGTAIVARELRLQDLFGVTCMGADTTLLSSDNWHYRTTSKLSPRRKRGSVEPRTPGDAIPREVATILQICYRFRWQMLKTKAM